MQKLFNEVNIIRYPAAGSAYGQVLELIDAEAAAHEIAAPQAKEPKDGGALREAAEAALAWWDSKETFSAQDAAERVLRVFKALRAALLAERRPEEREAEGPSDEVLLAMEIGLKDRIRLMANAPMRREHEGFDRWCIKEIEKCEAAMAWLRTQGEAT